MDGLATARKAWERGEPWSYWRAPGKVGRTGLRMSSLTFPRTSKSLGLDSSYAERVTEALAAIARHEVEKVVLARRETEPAADPIATLRVLEERFPTCWIFALSFGDKVFLGATPELLLRAKGQRLETYALAGTSLPGDDSLLESAKDLREHEHVVTAICSALAPFCVEVTAAPSPELMVLPNVQHLRTPIVGIMRDDVDTLEVVRALHPTPAVCGTPRNAARELIQRLEPFERGLYAGVVGVRDGDVAEYVVAIRSALLTRDETLVYAGAGIVEGSDPAAEDLETMRKLEAVTDALRFL